MVENVEDGAPPSTPPLALFVLGVLHRRDPLRHIARVWATYLAQSRAAATAAAAIASTGYGSDGLASLPLLGLSFGPATEPGPLDKTGRLPNELLESMFDFLDEDMTMNCASVARRYVRSLMAEGAYLTDCGFIKGRL